VHRAEPDLITKIEDYFNAHNNDPQTLPMDRQSRRHPRQRRPRMRPTPSGQPMTRQVASTESASVMLEKCSVNSLRIHTGRFSPRASSTPGPGVIFSRVLKFAICSVRPNLSASSRYFAQYGPSSRQSTSVASTLAIPPMAMIPPPLPSESRCRLTADAL